MTSAWRNRLILPCVQDFRAYPDGRVAYAAPASRHTSVEILRILGCGH